MSGRPFSIFDSNVDADRNGILLDPLPAGSYSGTGDNSISVENDGGRNGAYGPNYAQMDLRVGYRIRLGGARTMDVFAEVFNMLNRANFTNPTRRQAAADVPRRSTDWSRAASRVRRSSARASGSIMEQGDTDTSMYKDCFRAAGRTACRR